MGGVKRRRPRVGVIWCSNQRRGRSNGWKFPPNVEKHLRKLTEGKRVLQLFGGMSSWGVRLDIDPVVKPHVIGDAWLPPFQCNSFDVVIIDPPYYGINQQMKQMLLRQAAYLAKDSVIWFHTQWIAPDAGMRRRRAWLVRVGDSCAARCLQIFATKRGPKRKPWVRFTRGPALKYNRWMSGQMGLSFGEAEKESA